MAATWDLDLLGRGGSTAGSVVATVQNFCSIPAEDGIRFDADSIRGEVIRGSDEDAGVRVRLPQLPAEPGDLLSLRGRRTIGAAATVTLGLGNPVPNRLRPRLKLLRQRFRGSARPDQLDQLPAELRRIGTSCHGEFLHPKL